MSANRRKSKRLKVSSPCTVFLLLSENPKKRLQLESHFLNISRSGLGVRLTLWEDLNNINKQDKVCLQFRLQGQPLQKCFGIIKNKRITETEELELGIHFIRVTPLLKKHLLKMEKDSNIYHPSF